MNYFYGQKTEQSKESKEVKGITAQNIIKTM
jgi:hypothetical protein